MPPPQPLTPQCHSPSQTLLPCLSCPGAFSQHWALGKDVRNRQSSGHQLFGFPLLRQQGVRGSLSPHQLHFASLLAATLRRLALLFWLSAVPHCGLFVSGVFPEGTGASCLLPCEGCSVCLGWTENKLLNHYCLCLKNAFNAPLISVDIFSANLYFN